MSSPRQQHQECEQSESVGFLWLSVVRSLHIWVYIVKNVQPDPARGLWQWMWTATCRCRRLTQHLQEVRRVPVVAGNRRAEPRPSQRLGIFSLFIRREKLTQHLGSAMRPDVSREPKWIHKG